ncbi:MAG: class I SAM-dependent methyltransferase [Candidatus Scalinduaceae bacterium]
MSIYTQTDERVSWSEVLRKRDVIHKRYASIWQVPVLRKRFRLILSLLIDGARVLDVGAGDAGWGPRLQKATTNITYKTVDIDPNQSPDYRSMQEIQQEFDLIISLEVIEHLTLADGENMIRECERILSPGGKLVISTPNIFNPSRFLMDSTHLTPYSYEELGGLCLRAGLEVQEIYRTFNASTVQFFLKRAFVTPIHRFIGIDYTKSIIIVAKKRA